ncbi:hypothetical protein [Rhizobium rhizosphaerae]|uniref:hypothetical protein n=1 Tax=Xaviernesmea rhizosphaerae TaxID=1672749 RepID=UPI00117B7BD2|nr:hypothetical protein [Xaviernesmea rhizosphaerae]
MVAAAFPSGDMTMSKLIVAQPYYDGRIRMVGDEVEIDNADDRKSLIARQIVAIVQGGTEGEALRTDGPTVAEYVAAGYRAANYPPSGYASRSTAEEIAKAIEDEKAAEEKADTAAENKMEPEAENKAEPVASDTAEPQAESTTAEESAPASKRTRKAD